MGGEQKMNIVRRLIEPNESPSHIGTRLLLENLAAQRGIGEIEKALALDPASPQI